MNHPPDIAQPRAQSHRFVILLALIGLLIAGGLWAYLRQLTIGIGVTGLGRDVTWGLYIAQFTFAEGLAASALVVLLPLSLHQAAELRPLALFAVLVSIAAVCTCLLFILMDLGQPSRVFNVLLHPTPSSLMFWDMVSLGGYLVINVVIAMAFLERRRTAMREPRWLRALVLLSLPWGFAVHTVTAFLYSGMPGRSLWFTTILAPRFIASALAASAALMLLFSLLLERLGAIESGQRVRQRLGVVLAYALAATLFCLLPEFFSTFYGRLPEQVTALTYLYGGLSEHSPLAAASLLAVTLLLIALLLSLFASATRRETSRVVAAALTLAGIGIDKGFGLIIAGFVPTPLGAVPAYSPTGTEWLVVGGVWGIGALIVVVSFRVALESNATPGAPLRKQPAAEPPQAVGSPPA